MSLHDPIELGHPPRPLRPSTLTARATWAAAEMAAAGDRFWVGYLTRDVCDRLTDARDTLATLTDLEQVTP